MIQNQNAEKTINSFYQTVNSLRDKLPQIEQEDENNRINTYMKSVQDQLLDKFRPHHHTIEKSIQDSLTDFWFEPPPIPSPPRSAPRETRSGPMPDFH